MRKNIIGQILLDGKVMGTGFLITDDIVMTVKHNVLVADDCIMDEFKEKEVVFRIDDGDDIVGQTINLIEAIEKGIDCVFIKMNEVLSEDEMYDLVDVENEIVGVDCQIAGFPKLAKGKMLMSANIVKEQEENLIIDIKKQDQLNDYEGLSGSPVIVLGNVIGIIVRQENSERLEALSMKFIKNTLLCEEVQIKKKSIPTNVSEEKYNISNLKQKVEQVISMVGPRYSKTLDVKTITYNNLKFMLKKDSVKEYLLNISSQIKDCIKKLQNFDSYNKDENELILEKSRIDIEEIITQLKNDIMVLDSETCDKDEIRQISNHMNECKNKVGEIFEIEKNRFEKKNGEGTFDNKSWRGYMASYMCVFPTQYLDELNDVVKALASIAIMLDTSLINNVGNRAILITGKGGIGKTHLLCDIVNGFLEKDIPAVLLLGDMFRGKDSVDSVIIDWYQKGDTIENLFAWLNEQGNQNNVYVPICIDAINEVNDTSYWNSNLPLIIAKTKEYPNLKLIVSCRSIYLEEYLEEEKISDMVQVHHSGFDEMEVEALAEFGEFYGVNITYDTISVPEFMNPLFLKMLCEIALEKKDKTVVVDDIQTLMEEFFAMKNKIISKYYLDNFSVKDNVVSLTLSNVTQYMADNDKYSISWSELRRIIGDVLDEFGIKEKTAGFIKLLISENLLREADEKGTEITFAYQKFYEYIYAQKYASNEIDTIVSLVENNKMTLGTLEMIQIKYFKNTKEEFLSKISDRIHGESVETFMSGLYWRNEEEINENTVVEIEKLLRSQNEVDVRRAVLGLLAVSTKTKCAVNARYIHSKLCRMFSYKRDYFLSFFLLKQYDQVKVISDICERAIALNKSTYSDDSILLWMVVLCWGTGSNDIKLRDKASKGLVNLFKLYPSDILTIIELFKDVEDDYIHERVWQAVYSAIVLLAEQKYTIQVLEYIKNNIILRGIWPQNVLLRDYLRNIFEYAYYKDWCTKKDVDLARPPYKSRKHVVNKQYALQFKEKFSRLYWNCQESDFERYTIPSEVMDYGLTKKDVGLMIFEDMVKSGYGDMCKEYDSYIDYTYGSLRYRDEQVERIGKKYQKIYLYREMGNIFDNYKYAPKYRYSDVVELVYPEQGNSFRNIDLTIIPRINRFDGVKFIYPFYRYSKWSDKVWFKNNDVERYFPRLIECVYNGEEYYLLQGYLSSEEKKDEFREVWVQVRTYLYQKDKKSDLLRWFDGKDFEGRWMPEGFGQLYECCIGEYPWSPTMVNYLGLEEEQDFRQESPAPCYLITTVNDYTAEKDSPFCTIENSSYMLPSKYLMEKMNLSWDGAWGYDSIGRKAIIVGRNNTIYIKKSFLLDFMEQNELDIVWTVLGEKEKIITDYGTDFPGRREFSYTYYLGCKNELIRNHEKYNVVKSQKY